MNWNVVEFINSLAEMGLIGLFFSKVMNGKPCSLWIKAVGFAAAAAVMTLVSVMNSPPEILLTVTFTLLLFLAFAFYEEKAVKKTFYSFMYIIVILFADPVFIGISYTFKIFTYDNLFRNGAGRIVGMVITKIMYLWLSAAFARVLTKKVRELPLKYWINILLTPVISVIILSGMVLPLLQQEDTDGYILYIFSVVGIVYLNLSMLDFFDAYSKQIKLSFMEAVAEREEENYRSLKMSYQEMKKLKHDFRNELDILEKLITERKYTAAEEHLSELSRFIDNSAAVCYTGNEAADSLINIKIQAARLADIRVIIKVKLTSELNANSMELCRILGNALDNAIEACKNAADEQPFVCISVKEIEDNILIEISNSSVGVDLTELSSTKPNKNMHGYGIQSIRSSADRMGGTVHFKYDDGVFVMRLLINNG